MSGKLKGFFGSGDSTSAEGNADEPETSTTTGSASKTTASAAKETSTSVPLVVDTRYTSVAPMSVEAKKEARSRLIAAEAAELVVAQREEQRNVLEGYLYRLRDLLEGDGERPFFKCSTKEERERIKSKMEEAMSWFQQNQDDAETAGFVEQRATLECVSFISFPFLGCSWLIVLGCVYRALEYPIMHRYKEIEEFPSVLNNSQMWNFHTRMFLTEEKAILSELEANGTTGRYTREELDDLERTLKDHERWLDQNVEKQRKVQMWEDPAIETKEMKEKAKVLELALQKLVRKPKPKAKKASSSSSSGSSSSSPSQSASAKAEESTTTTSAGEESTPGHHDEL